MQRWCRRPQRRSNARHCNVAWFVNSRPAILEPSEAGRHDRAAAGASWGFRLGVLGVYISDEPPEELGAATGQNACGAIGIPVQAEDGCEEKITLRVCPVHSPFTPASLMLMVAVLPFKRGDQRAPARR